MPPLSPAYSYNPIVHAMAPFIRSSTIFFQSRKEYVPITGIIVNAFFRDNASLILRHRHQPLFLWWRLEA
jgi:hypothetical protein